MSEEVIIEVAREIYKDRTLEDDIKNIIKFYEKNKIKTDNGMLAYGTALEIGARRKILTKLAMGKIVDVIQSARRTTFVISLDTIKALGKVLEHVSKIQVQGGIECDMPGYIQLNSGMCIPNDLFDVIVGLDDVKDLIRSALNATKPVHVLMIGPPATGKSLFLEELTRVYYRTPVGWAHPTINVMGGASRAGIRDYIIERQPSLLLIDEIDKVRDARDWSVLLSIMDPGILSVTLHGKVVQKKVKIWVIAAGNKITTIRTSLPPELLSRFLPPIKIKEYSKDQMIEVITNVLYKREGADLKKAERIGKIVVGNGLSIRNAVSLARLCNNDPVCVERKILQMSKFF